MRHILPASQRGALAEVIEPCQRMGRMAGKGEMGWNGPSGQTGRNGQSSLLSVQTSSSQGQKHLTDREQTYKFVITNSKNW